MLTQPLSKSYPLLYWTTLIYILGFPNFVKFDQSGRTPDAINFTSITNIVICFIAGYLMTVMLLLDRKPVVARRVHVDLGLWILLGLELALSSFLEPHSRTSVHTMNNQIITVFRLGQWVVGLGLIIALYTRTPAERATELVVQFIGRISWISLAMVFIVLPIYPSQVYGGSEDTNDAVRRLGGQFIGPASLAIFASMAFFYALLFFPRGVKRLAGCVLSALTLALTHARFQQVGFILAVLLYLMVFSGSTVLRWLTSISLVGLVIAALPFGGGLLKSFARGQSLQTLSTLDDRTRVWSAAWDAIKHRPIIGYGYNQGAKHALRDYWFFQHWIPPHAHNELLEFWLAGGIIAVLIALYLYGHVFFVALKEFRRGPQQLFLFITFLICGLTTFSGTPFSYSYSTIGGLLVFCFFGILGGSTRVEKLQHIPAARRQYEEVIVG